MAADVELEAAKAAIRRDRQHHGELPLSVEELLDDEPETLRAAGVMIAALARRVLELEDRIAAEVRTRRLVVVDATGNERAIIECRTADPLRTSHVLEADFVHLDLLAVESSEGANASARLWAGTTTNRYHGHGARASVGAESTADGRRASSEVGASWHPTSPLAGGPNATGVLNLMDTSRGGGVHLSPARRRVADGLPLWPTEGPEVVE